MKLYKGELIIFFVSGREAKVYNLSAFFTGNFWVNFPNFYRPKIKSVTRGGHFVPSLVKKITYSYFHMCLHGGGLIRT